MNEAAAIQKIQNYIDNRLPVISWPKCEFEVSTYSRWAAYEIMERIIDEASLLPPHITGREPKSYVQIIEEFIETLDRMFDISDTVQSQFMFSIAKDTARDILLLFTKGESNE